jgi:hypothetical protein
MKVMAEMKMCRVQQIKASCLLCQKRASRSKRVADGKWCAAFFVHGRKVLIKILLVNYYVTWLEKGDVAPNVCQPLAFMLCMALHPN